MIEHEHATLFTIWNSGTLTIPQTWSYGWISKWICINLVDCSLQTPSPLSLSWINIGMYIQTYTYIHSRCYRCDFLQCPIDKMTTLVTETMQILHVYENIQITKTMVTPTEEFTSILNQVKANFVILIHIHWENKKRSHIFSETGIESLTFNVRDAWDECESDISSFIKHFWDG